jgi:hypothetical protein
MKNRYLSPKNDSLDDRTDVQMRLEMDQLVARAISIANQDRRIKEVGDRVLVCDGTLDFDPVDGKNVPGYDPLFQERGIVIEVGCNKIAEHVVKMAQAYHGHDPGKMQAYLDKGRCDLLIAFKHGRRKIYIPSACVRLLG